MKSKWLTAAALCLAVVVSSFAQLPADTEVLVLVDGSRLEIQGEVRVEGRRLTFTDSRGQLSMLRTSEVDLEATTKANQPKPDTTAADSSEQPPVESKPVMTLTNADIRTVDESEVVAPQFGRKVTIYSASWCPACRIAKKTLDVWRIKYDERDIDKDPLARAEKNEKDPNCGIPVIDVDGQLMCGLQTKRLAEMLLSAGLEPVFDK